MVLLETAANAVDVATVVAGRLPESLSPAAKTLFTALVAAAVETGRGRGYSPHTTHLTMHLPLEVLADVCGMHRVTAWRHLPALRELGVLDYRPHKSTLRGETRNSGMLWQVRLNPAAGSKARLSYDDLKHKWRDLQKDVLRKRTAYRQLRGNVQQSTKASTSGVDIKPLLAWTLPPSTTSPRLSTDSCTARSTSLETLLDVKSCPREERNRMVALAAQALSQALSDHSGLNYYQRLLWQLLRRFDATGEDYSYSVYLMSQRARTDVLESFSRKGGAVFVSRLKQADWYEWVMNAPPNRVGVRPN